MISQEDIIASMHWCLNESIYKNSIDKIGKHLNLNGEVILQKSQLHFATRKIVTIVSFLMKNEVFWVLIFPLAFKLFLPLYLLLTHLSLTKLSTMSLACTSMMSTVLNLALSLRSRGDLTLTTRSSSCLFSLVAYCFRASF